MTENNVGNNEDQTPGKLARLPDDLPSVSIVVVAAFVPFVTYVPSVLYRCLHSNRVV